MLLEVTSKLRNLYEDDIGNNDDDDEFLEEECEEEKQAKGMKRKKMDNVKSTVNVTKTSRSFVLQDDFRYGSDCGERIESEDVNDSFPPTISALMVCYLHSFGIIISIAFFYYTRSFHLSTFYFLKCSIIFSYDLYRKCFMMS